LDPPGPNDESYSEQTIRLPHAFWCYDPLTDSPAPGPLPMAKNGRVTFGCLNSFAKVNRQVLELWARVLLAVPDSGMLILCNPGSARQRTIDELQSHGAKPDRIEFTGTLRRPDYLQAYHSIDLALDTFPANGHTTTLDGLWMGVPVVTLPGRTAISRGSLSILSNLGMTEFVASSSGEFVRIASDWATNPGRLAQLRMGLRQRMESSPLMDAAGFARDMEEVFTQMWRKSAEST
jgi:predicted O-linked N-acetylglucosamine transferase (SPINDLY family)